METTEKKKDKNYINGNELWAELKASVVGGELTPDALSMIQKIANNLSRTFRYKYPEDKEDCICGGITDMLFYWKNYNPFNKHLLKELIRLELWELSWYEFCSKQHEPKKTLSPERIFISIEGEIVELTKVIKNSPKIVYFGYSADKAKIEKIWTTTLDTIEKSKILSLQVSGEYDVLLEERLKAPEKISHEYINPYTKESETVELTRQKLRKKLVCFTGDYKDKKIDLSCEEVFPHIVWSEEQKKCREVLYKTNSLKNIDFIPKELVDEYAYKVKSNAFAYVTQCVKCGMSKVWKCIHSLKESNKISLSINSVNNGFFNI